MNNKTVAVVGASGATGTWVVKHLLEKDYKVKVVVRSVEKLPTYFKDDEKVHITQATLLDLSDTELKAFVKDCDAIVSCLGHNLTFKGIYGKPRRLVTDATRRLCEATMANQQQTKFVLMNTSGNSNRDLNEKISFAQKCVIGLLRLLLPPHVDNEQAADYLRTKIGQNHKLISWTAVRPDGLIDEETVSAYEVHPSPIRSAIFNAGRVSRINVAHFMVELIRNEQLRQKWKGQMPIIYSKVT